MRRTPRAWAAAGFFAAGVAVSGLVVFLQRQGLERASLWATILAFFLTVIIAASGILVAWFSVMTLRETRNSNHAPESSLSLGVNEANLGYENSGDKRVDLRGDAKFNIHAQRDAYTAEEMTVINISDDASSEVPDGSSSEPGCSP